MDNTLTEAQKEEKGKKAAALFEKTIELKKAFLLEHASSIAGLWLIEDILIRSQIEIEEVAKLMETVNLKYSDISYFKKLSACVEGYKATGAGMTAPKITGTNALDRKVFDLP